MARIAVGLLARRCLLSHRGRSRSRCTGKARCRRLTVPWPERRRAAEGSGWSHRACITTWTGAMSVRWDGRYCVQSARCRKQIIHLGRRHDLAVLVVDDAFEERSADALCEPSGKLSLDQHRVDHRSAVLDPDQPADLDRASVSVHLEDGGDTPVGAGGARIMEPRAGEVRLGFDLSNADVVESGLRDLAHAERGRGRPPHPHPPGRVMVTRISPTLWSALGVSTTSFLSGCRLVVDSFSGTMSLT
jgi:hypothetical protein